MSSQLKSSLVFRSPPLRSTLVGQGSVGWTSPLVLGMLAGGVVTAIAFVLNEAKFAKFSLFPRIAFKAAQDHHLARRHVPQLRLVLPAVDVPVQLSVSCGTNV